MSSTARRFRKILAVGVLILFACSIALLIGSKGLKAQETESHGHPKIIAGHVFLEAGEWEKAKDAFADALLSEDPDVRVAARDGLREALKSIEPVGSAQLAIGQAYLEAGDAISALPHFVDAARSADISVATAALEGISDALRVNSKAASSLKMGEIFASGGAWDEAIAAFSDAAKSSDPTLSESGRRGVAQALEQRDSGASLLDLGRIYASVGDWDHALEAFQSATQSNNSTVADEALSALKMTVDAKNAGVLGIRAMLPNPVNRWVWIDYVVYAAFLLVAFLIVHALLSSRLARRLVELVLKPERTKAQWRTSLAGHAEEPLKSLVLDEFVVAMRELRRDGDSFRSLTAVGPNEARFYVPLSLESLVGPDLVVQGVDLSWIASLFQKLLDHFRYQFEVRVETVEDHAYVFATLSWGGRTEQSWQIPGLADDSRLCYRQTGRALAHSVFGDELRKT